METTKKVWTPQGTGKRIARAMDVSPEMVSYSLNGKKDTELARKIRYVAVKEYGGKYLNEDGNFAPECDSVVRPEGGEFYYDDHYKVTLDNKKHIAHVWCDGEEIGTVRIETISQMMDLHGIVDSMVRDSMKSDFGISK